MWEKASQQQYPWGVIVNNPVALATITMLRSANNSPTLVQGTIDFTIQERKLLLGCAPYSSSWDGLSASAFENIINYHKFLTKQSYNIDDCLSTTEKAEIKGLITIVRDKIVPAVVFCTWLNEENYNRTTKPALSKFRNFPLNLFLPWKTQLKIASDFEKIAKFNGTCVDLVTGEVDWIGLEKHYERLAVEGIDLLANRLRTSQGRFFYGENICSLDCILFGYLGIVRGAPWANRSLQLQLIKFKNLTNYLDEISSELYPSIPKPSTTSVPEKVNEKLKKWDKYFRMSVAFCFVAVVLTPAILPKISGLLKSRKSNKTQFIESSPPPAQQNDEQIQLFEDIPDY